VGDANQCVPFAVQRVERVDARPLCPRVDKSKAESYGAPPPAEILSLVLALMSVSCRRKRSYGRRRRSCDRSPERSPASDRKTQTLSKARCDRDAVGHRRQTRKSVHVLSANMQVCAQVLSAHSPVPRRPWARPLLGSGSCSSSGNRSISMQEEPSSELHRSRRHELPHTRRQAHQAAMARVRLGACACVSEASRLWIGRASVSVFKVTSNG
jgi:hypothetical protein